MEDYLSIFQGILSTRGSFLDIYLRGLEDHRKFTEQPNEPFELVQCISSLLTKPDKRYLGLRLLASFIDDCPINTFEKKINLWTNLVLKCNNHEMQYEANLIYDVLGKIIKKSQQSPDLAKTFPSLYLCKVYECLVNVSSSKANFALKCIKICLQVYPTSSYSSKGVIEKFLWKNIDRIDDEIVTNCGKCLHLLQQVKGGGVLGVNYKSQWKSFQIQLLGGIHAVYNEMFANCVEMYDDKVELEKLPWDEEQIEFDSEPVKKAAQMYTRCHNLIKYLEITLSEPFPVKKPILLKKILNVINRGLSVNCNMLEKNPIADNIALSILLPRLHVDLLDLLNVILLILRGHLRPYSDLVLGLTVDAMKWTSIKSTQGDQKMLYLRKKVYETLARWCKIFQSGNRIDTIAEYLFQQILYDITPIQNEFSLKVLSGARKHMSKKGRRQLHNIQNEKLNIGLAHFSDGTGRKILKEKNQGLCISALRCLQDILFSSANFIKPTTLMLIQTNVIRICTMLCERPLKTTTHLFSNKKCRIEIYNTLYAILMTPHILCPPPTEIALAMIQTAFMRDPSVKVRVHCGFILQNFERFIHPQKESLLFTVDSRDIRKTSIKFGKENLLHNYAVMFSSSLSSNGGEIEYANEDSLESNEIISERTNVDVNGVESQSKNLLSNHNSSLKNGSYNIGKINTSLVSADLDNDNLVGSYEDINLIDYTVDKNEVNLNINQFVDQQANRKDAFSIIATDDVPQKSREFVLRADAGRGDMTTDEAVSEYDQNVNEPTQKKKKIDKENEIKINETIINDHDIEFDEDEDTMVADIVSQFVDELD